MAQLPKGGLGYGAMINQYMRVASSTFEVVYIIYSNLKTTLSVITAYTASEALAATLIEADQRMNIEALRFQPDKRWFLISVGGIFHMSHEKKHLVA